MQFSPAFACFFFLFSSRRTLRDVALAVRFLKCECLLSHLEYYHHTNDLSVLHALYYSASNFMQLLHIFFNISLGFPVPVIYLSTELLHKNITAP